MFLVQILFLIDMLKLSSASYRFYKSEYVQFLFLTSLSLKSKSIPKILSLLPSPKYNPTSKPFCLNYFLPHTGFLKVFDKPKSRVQENYSIPTPQVQP